MPQPSGRHVDLKDDDILDAPAVALDGVQQCPARGMPFGDASQKRPKDASARQANRAELFESCHRRIEPALFDQLGERPDRGLLLEPGQKLREPAWLQ